MTGVFSITILKCYVQILNVQTPFLVVGSRVMGRSVGSVVRGPVRVGVMRGRGMVGRRRGVGGGLVVAVGRRGGRRVSGGRLKMNLIQKSSQGKRIKPRWAHCVL